MFFNFILNYYKNKKNKAADLVIIYNNLLQQFNKREKHYTTKAEYEKFIILYQKLIFQYQKNIKNKYLLLEKKILIKELITKIKSQQILNNIDKYNNKYFQEVIKKLPLNFFKFENIKLDNYQISSILKEEKNNIVIAGAGSGKSTTILGKIKYLVEELKVPCDSILVLSYTKKSVNDLQQKINQHLKYNLLVKTFHSFAYRFLREVEKNYFDLESDDSLINNLINKLYSSDETFKKLFLLVNNYYLVDKKINNSYNLKNKESDEEYYELLKSKQEYLTYNSEILRSKEEVKLANWFYLHKIKYEYETSYKYQVADEKHKQYRPDFYLPDYDIYWEHYGLNQNFHTQWEKTDPIKDKNYIDEYFFKKNIHQTKKLF